MNVIRPVTFTPAMLIASNAMESVPLWNMLALYDMGNQVYLGQSVYESLTNANTGNNPAMDPINWLRIGSTNQYAMFDSEVNTQTSAMGNLEVQVAPGTIFDSLALLNIAGTSVNVAITDGAGGPEIYNKTVSLDASNELVVDWFTYFFEPFQLNTDLVLTDIPPYSSARVFVSIFSGGEAKCGLLLTGSALKIGETQLGVGVGIRDYSTKETDALGVTTFVERNFSKRMSPTVFIDNSKLNAIFRSLSQIRAKPTVFIGTQAAGYEALIIYGFLKDWNIEIPYPENSLLSMEIEGLI